MRTVGPNWRGKGQTTKLVQFSLSVMSNSLQHHEPQLTRPPCPSPTPRAYPNPCPLSRWCQVKGLHNGECCTQCQQIRKTQQWPQDWKRSVFIPIPKKGNVKECSNYDTIALSHASKVMLTPGFNSTWTVNFQMFKLDLEKTEAPEITLPTSAESLKKQDCSRKTFTSVYWLYQSLCLCVC